MRLLLYCISIGISLLLSVSSATAQPDLIFADGFESGDLSAWDAVVRGPIEILGFGPMQAESGVALGRETILSFSHALAADSVTDAAIYAEAGEVPIPATIHLSADLKRVTLFYDSPLPESSEVRVWVQGGLLTGFDGQGVDGNGDGLAGGVFTVAFTTQGLDTVSGTRVCGRVLASETSAEGSDVPLEGVTISVDGAESIYSAVTDDVGNYCLDPAPASRFFVHIDGSTATAKVPEGAYYPTVGKAFQPQAGMTVHVGESYLPLIAADTLQSVSETDDTVIPLPPSVLADFPELAGAELTVPAGSLFFDNGLPGTTAGIAPVPSDRLPGNLPADLEFPLVLTVQTDGATNFDVFAPICFPNLPQPTTGEILPAGTMQSLVSFDHDAGRWRAVGSMTVGPSGDVICTNGGAGIVAPGWHLPSPPPIDPPLPPSPLPVPGPNPPHSSPPPTPTPPPTPSPPPDEPDQCSEGLDWCTNSCIARGAYCGAAWSGLGVACGIAVRRLPAPKILRGALGQYCKSTVPEAINDCTWAGESCLDDCFDRCSSRGTRTPATDSRGLEGSDPVLDQIADISGQIGSLLEPHLYTGLEVPSGVLAAVDTLIDQADGVAGGDALGYTRAAAGARWDQVDYRIPPGNSPATEVLFLAEFLVGDGIVSQRGSTGPYGQFTLFPPFGSTVLRVRFYDPYTHSFGTATPVELESGTFGMTRFYLHPVDDALVSDFDGDQLADVIEAIYGSNAAVADTDGDGTSDRDEIIAGTDLLGRDIDIGEIVSGEISFAGELDRYAFAALAGQRVFLDQRAGATLGFDWIIMDSDGNSVFDRPFFGDGGTVELVRGGTYTLYLGDESSSSIGTYEFQLWNVPAPDEFDLSIGDLVSDGVPGPGAGNIETPGRQDIYRFAGTAGQTIFADNLAGSTTGWDWRLEDPNGTVLFDQAFFGDAGSHELPTTGSYVLTVGDVDDDQVGTYSFRLWDVPPPDEFDIAIGDVVSVGVPGPGAGSIETPGRLDVYRFSASAGQTIYADNLAGSTTGWDWRLEDPNGTVVFDQAFFGDAGSHELPTAGIYVLTVGDVDDDQVGTYSFRLWDVPPPNEFDIVIGDVVSDGVPGPGAGSIETPGRLDVYRFSASAGQTIYADNLAGSTTGWDWRLEDPNGTVVFDQAFFGDAGSHELPSTGIYVLTVGDVNNDHVGVYSFRLWNVPPPDEFDIAIGDVVSDGSPGPGAGNIESPGRQDIYRFSASAGQTIYADNLAGSTTGWDWRLEDPNGTVIFDQAFFGDAGTHVLPTAGIYVLTLGDIDNDHVGPYSFQIRDESPP